jgi:hypothetical protein
MPPPDAGAAREYLDKIVASPGFQNSDRLCRFLRFIVEAKLRGEHDRIKEYVIGKEVFDRDGQYDPRIDPIVRVEARRLRKKLDEYYAGQGSADAVRIDFPKGAYVPEIHAWVEEQQAPPAPKPGAPRVFAIVAAMLLAAAIGGGWLLWLRPATTPGVVAAVVPARWIWQAEDFPDIRHDEDLAERMAAHFAANNDIRAISWPSLQRFRNAGLKLEAIGKEIGATRMIVVAVRVESDGFRVTSFLIDPAANGRKLNVVDKRAQTLDSPRDREALAASLAAGQVWQ